MNLSARLVALGLSVLALAAAPGPYASAQCDPHWSDAFPGSDLNDAASAMVVFDDGTGPALYVGGSFTNAGGVAANYIAKWDGHRWSPLSTQPGGLSGAVYALAVFDDGTGPALYAGGAFTYAYGQSVNRIARWNGTQWTALGSGVSHHVKSLAVHDDGSGQALYAGGAFATAGGSTVNYIARWNGTAWSDLGGGMGGSAPYVNALLVYDDGLGDGPALYATGRFTTAGGATVNSIAKWDGAAWSPLGSGAPGGYVNALASYDGDGPGQQAALLYAAGAFTTIGGISASAIASWDGSSWSALGSGMGEVSPLVDILAVYDHDGAGPDLPTLHVGGTFTTAGGLWSRNIACWTGAGWRPMGSGLGGSAYAMMLFDDDGPGPGPEALYVAGSFTSAGSVVANRIARYDGSTWSPLGLGVDSGYQVNALAAFDDDGAGANGTALFVAGAFSGAGGIPAACVAKWDGASRSALSSGVSGTAYALAVFDDGSGPGLYAGGTFTTAGGIPASRIARWNGTSWSALGSGADAQVNALAAFDEDRAGPNPPALFVGGQFTNIGGGGVAYLARWNGTTWSAVGGGVNGWVSSLAVLDAGTGPTLYVGGYFSSAGGIGSPCIAKWDGTSWSGFGSGMGGFEAWVHAFAVYDDGTGAGPALYAGGSFETAGGQTVNNIARWDGTAWSGLAGGANSFVYALSPFDDGWGEDAALYAGGPFSAVAGIPSQKIGRWGGCPPTVGVDDGPRGPGDEIGVLLLGAAPNPSGDESRIFYSLDHAGCIELTVYDASGRLVRDLVSGMSGAGTQSIVWNGRDRYGRRVPRGVYFCRLDAGGRLSSRALVRSE